MAQKSSSWNGLLLGFMDLIDAECNVSFPSIQWEKLLFVLSYDFSKFFGILTVFKYNKPENQLQCHDMLVNVAFFVKDDQPLLLLVKFV